MHRDQFRARSVWFFTVQCEAVVFDHRSRIDESRQYHAPSLLLRALRRPCCHCSENTFKRFISFPYCAVSERMCGLSNYPYRRYSLIILCSIPWQWRLDLIKAKKLANMPCCARYWAAYPQAILYWGIATTVRIS